MPVLVNCPSCNGPLRVADELLGRKVRCPACQTIFEATDPSAARNDRRQDEEVERVDSWKQLDLEMASDRDPAPPPPPPPPSRSSAPPPPPMPGLVGAIELDAGPQEPPRRSAPADDRRAEDDRPGPRRDEGDLRPCPGCQRMIHRDSTRCFNCGERLVLSSRDRDRDRDRDRRGDSRNDRRDFRRSAYDDRDEFGGPPRRDSEPHRGTTVLVLGILSLVCLLGTCLMAPNVIGAVLGLLGWWMGHVDLAKIKSGSMDPEGEGATQGGWICSIIGTVLNLLCVLACGGWILVSALQDMERNQRQQPPGFQKNPPAKMINVKPGKR